VWLIEGEPGRARVYRTLHLAASRAKESIWITDAYFVAPRPLSEALAAAAQQGVDVRILVPAHNNWPIVGTMSRGGYRPLIRAGVRIFEWQGPMMHAKTSVVDGAWCRVGSSNLNTASLMGNWELDIGILDEGFGRQLAGLFLADLASSTEIVLPGRRPPLRGFLPGGGAAAEESLDPEGPLSQRVEQLRARGQAHGRLTLASVVRAREVLGGALAGNRPLGREDRTVLGTASVAILLVALFAMLFPSVVGWLVAIAAGWIGLTTGARAFLQRRRARVGERSGALQLGTREGDSHDE
jgi:cardiolipin synthase